MKKLARGQRGRCGAGWLGGDVAFSIITSSALSRSHTHTHFVHYSLSLRFHLARLLVCLAFLFASAFCILTFYELSFSMGTPNNATGQDSLIHTHAGVSLHEWKVISKGCFILVCW